MDHFEYIRADNRRRKNRHRRGPIIGGCVLLVGICCAGAIFFAGKMKNNGNGNGENSIVIGADSNEATSSDATNETDEAVSVETTQESLLEQASALATGYDYDGAIALLSDSAYAGDPAVQEAIAGYENTKSTLVQVDVNTVTHVFFHTLVWDTAKAFDGDSRTAGYNQVMTTVDEFNKIIQTMYDEGYVLVRLHDLAYETTDENGNPVMKPGTIMLPEGKIPFVMSQDDLCYYPYMDGDGFASRIIIGDDGKPTCEMKMDDGSTTTGSFDLVPILEDFIGEHPDFSYEGARAVLAFTGYEGILGYRTSSSYAETSPTYEQDREEATKVAQCLRDQGWELASHSWGHLNLGTVDYERFKTDTDKWENEVESLIGPTDIILFPFGADVGDWHPYTNENERFNYLHSVGFRYFCTVDSTKAWVQFGQDYFRQGRRNLDGYRMWKDITAEDPSTRKLDDLFQAENVFDSARPTPVPEM